jgi:hypothetical protein
MARQVMETHFAEPVFVAVSGEGFSAIGQMKDIRPRGFVYEYTEDGSTHPDSATAVIFSGNRNLYFKRISCRPLDDERGRTRSTSLSSTRRCLLKYGKLDSGQQRDLQVFLRNSSVDSIKKTA